MARRGSRRGRRFRKQTDNTIEEVTGFIEANPVTSAVAALAAGAIATSVFKMALAAQAAQEGEEEEGED